MIFNFSTLGASVCSHLLDLLFLLVVWGSNLGASGLPFGPLASDVFRFWDLLWSLWLPFDSRWLALAPFGSLWVHFWFPFGYATFWLPFGSLGFLWFPVVSFWLPFGSLWFPFSSHWLCVGSLLAYLWLCLVSLGSILPTFSSSAAL